MSIWYKKQRITALEETVTHTSSPVSLNLLSFPVEDWSLALYKGLYYGHGRIANYVVCTRKGIT